MALWSATATACIELGAMLVRVAWCILFAEPGSCRSDPKPTLLLTARSALKELQWLSQMAHAPPSGGSVAGVVCAFVSSREAL